MKKVVLALVIISMGFAVQAQDNQIRHRGKRDQSGKIAEKLNFSDDQQAKLKSLNEDFRNQMTDLKKNDNITVKEWKSKMETLRNDHRSKIQGLLTSEQKNKMEKMKAERKGLRDVDTKARMEKMKLRLNLTDEQASKMAKNREEMASKFNALREDKNLDKEKKREEMKELAKQQKEKMKSILTEEQMKKFQEGRGKRPLRKKII